jgi:hypothetical protein
VRSGFVVSTDDNQVPVGTAAAFIATVQIVQQFVPVEVWWQGAWLNEDKTRGFVFHVPLVQGDMDFSRLEFCIADTRRDLFSFLVMSTHCVIDLRESWNDCGHRAEKSYLPESPGYKNFVAHNGIRPEASSIPGTRRRGQHCVNEGWQSFHFCFDSLDFLFSSAIERV